jgi:phenylalanyl-tRNA synthetase beta chain
MTISYNWLHEYLPEKLDPEALSNILTSIGLEVESMEVRGAMDLSGLVCGEVTSCEKHPDADKLRLTEVNVGNGESLQIVCGAPNVEKGQKVIVARIGTTLLPLKGAPLTIKKAKIRGVESQGMICAADEIGIGEDHSGIFLLPENTPVGITIDKVISSEKDFIYEIGLTPNRMDAMSHWGVARDVCAYLSHHNAKAFIPNFPIQKIIASDNNTTGVSIEIKDLKGCRRYCGMRLDNVVVKESPVWLKNKLQSIGLKPINNVVDVTNFILHETGQPLHAFDLSKISNQKILVQYMPAGTPFVALDQKEYKLSESDLMICDDKGPLCMAGIYGGLHSGVGSETVSVLLESAWFDPISIRRSSLHHGLRTEAATRFEKGCDIGQTDAILWRASKMLEEVTGGHIIGSIIDIYPEPLAKKAVTLEFDYLRKLSGKNYASAVACQILQNLGFGILTETSGSIEVSVPTSKSDIHLPCDLVEEIMRIDGLDHITIPEFVHIKPSVQKDLKKRSLKEKAAEMLADSGFFEIMTNSISNLKYHENKHPVKMMNSLSADLNVMRPSMLESGLEAISHNLNHRNDNLCFFEFGKTYHHAGDQGRFLESDHLILISCGAFQSKAWNGHSLTADFFFLKGVLEKLLTKLGLVECRFEKMEDTELMNASNICFGKTLLGKLGEVHPEIRKKMDIKNTSVWFADLDWEKVISLAGSPVTYQPISRFPWVERDLAMVLGKELTFAQIEETVTNLQLAQLKSLHLFDIFESEKLGKDKKSMALRFVFNDESKTMTDEETEGLMRKITHALENKLKAEIRK